MDNTADSADAAIERCLVALAKAQRDVGSEDYRFAATRTALRELVAATLASADCDTCDEVHDLLWRPHRRGDVRELARKVIAELAESHETELAANTERQKLEIDRLPRVDAALGTQAHESTIEAARRVVREREELRKDYAAAVIDANEEVSSLRTDVDRLTRERDATRVALTRAQIERGEARDELAETKKLLCDRSPLKRALDEAETELSEARADAQRWHERNLLLEKRLASIREMAK